MLFFKSLCCTFLGSVWGKPLPVVASSIQSVDVSRSTLHQKPDAYKAQTGSVTGEWWLFFTENFFELAYVKMPSSCIVSYTLAANLP